MASYTGGSAAKSRIRALEAERKKQQDELQRKRGTIEAASREVATKVQGSNFASRSEAVEDIFKSDAVGLVTHDDFIARRKHLERCAADERIKREAVQRNREAESNRKKLKKANKAALSFTGDSESDDPDSDEDRSPPEKANVSTKKSSAEKDSTPAANGNGKEKESVSSVQPAAKRRRIGKNPEVDTKFLPDREREIEEQEERERLKQEWLNEQEAIKSEIVKITYSYWDGSGHRRIMRCKKGTTIGRFLAMVQPEFKQLRNMSADSLMFIKEDLIIPHHYSFYDFIVTKARGKSGPLFSFDVVEDVRLVADAKKEKEDAHAAKVVERRFYERNRHVWPYSRWEVYDPTKTYSRYTIHGD